MAMSPETENLFRHLVLLSAIKNAPPELHKAIMNNVQEDQLKQHLQNHVQDLHRAIQQSAQGGEQSAPAEAGKPAGNTALRAVQFLNDASKAAPAPESAPSAGPQSRANRVSKLLGGK
jgi:hypothetical protein